MPGNGRENVGCYKPTSCTTPRRWRGEAGTETSQGAEGSSQLESLGERGKLLGSTGSASSASSTQQAFPGHSLWPASGCLPLQTHARGSRYKPYGTGAYFSLPCFMGEDVEMQRGISKLLKSYRALGEAELRSKPGPIEVWGFTGVGQSWRTFEMQ